MLLFVLSSGLLIGLSYILDLIMIIM